MIKTTLHLATFIGAVFFLRPQAEAQSLRTVVREDLIVSTGLVVMPISEGVNIIEKSNKGTSLYFNDSVLVFKMNHVAGVNRYRVDRVYIEDGEQHVVCSNGEKKVHVVINYDRIIETHSNKNGIPVSEDKHSIDVNLYYYDKGLVASLTGNIRRDGNSLSQFKKNNGL